MEEQKPEVLREALNIIHDKALTLSNMLLEDNPDLGKIASGVELIVALARYGFDIRSIQDIEEMEREASEVEQK